MLDLLFVLALLDPLISMDRIDRQEVHCLAETIYHEARGEPIAGQLLVADTVLNRVRHPDFPDTVCAVVTQEHQFAHGLPILETDAWRWCIELAIMRMVGFVPPQSTEVLFFFEPSKVWPDWADHMKRVTKVGGHLFLTYPERII